MHAPPENLGNAIYRIWAEFFSVELEISAKIGQLSRTSCHMGDSRNFPGGGSAIPFVPASYWKHRKPKFNRRARYLLLESHQRYIKCLVNKNQRNHSTWLVPIPCINWTTFTSKIKTLGKISSLEIIFLVSCGNWTLLQSIGKETSWNFEEVRAREILSKFYVQTGVCWCFLSADPQQHLLNRYDFTYVRHQPTGVCCNLYKMVSKPYV